MKLTPDIENEDVNLPAAELDLAGDIKYDNNRRYWLRFHVSDFECRMMPGVFINRVKKKAHIECQTLSMVKLNQRITNSAEEVVMMSDKVVQELLDSIRTRAPQMFRVCEGISLLDMLASFCHTITSQDYARPVLAGTLAIKAARHPILEKASYRAGHMYGCGTNIYGAIVKGIQLCA